MTSALELAPAVRGHQKKKKKKVEAFGEAGGSGIDGGERIDAPGLGGHSSSLIDRDNSRGGAAICRCLFVGRVAASSPVAGNSANGKAARWGHSEAGEAVVEVGGGASFFVSLSAYRMFGKSLWSSN